MVFEIIDTALPATRYAAVGHSYADSRCSTSSHGGTFSIPLPSNCERHYDTIWSSSRSKRVRARRPGEIARMFESASLRGLVFRTATCACSATRAKRDPNVGSILGSRAIACILSGFSPPLCHNAPGLTATDIR